MNAAQLLAYFDRMSDAADAVPRLRRFIFDLAVRGKLVSQDPNDEPASELLMRIASEKARLVRTGDLRKPRDLGDATAFETPFSVPASWRWVRLDDVGAIVGGGTPPASAAENFADPGQGIPWLTPADLGGYLDLYISRGARDLSENGARASSATVMPAGTVLFTSRAPIGYVAIAANPISTNQGFKSIVPYVADCSRFIAMVMKAFAPTIDAKAPGTTFKEVSGKIVAAIPFPLAPLAEQRRIVVKVDELMALCDRLEVARAEREATRTRLTTASLARLNVPDPDPAVFSDHARFALDHIASLTARTDQVTEVRRTILNLAVRGKLVPQNSNDESIVVAMRRQPADAGRSGLAPESNDAVAVALACGLPAGWAYLRASRVADFVDPQPSHRTPQEHSGGVPYVGYADILDSGDLDLANARKVSPSVLEEHRRRYVLNAGDFVIGKIGTIGDPVPLPEPFNYALSANLILVQPRSELMAPGYLMAYIESPLGYSTLWAEKTDSTHAVFGIKKARNLLIPVPPRAEQNRIVTKVQELMGLCDRLEASLVHGEEGRSRLLEAVLHEALAPTLEEAA